MELFMGIFNTNIVRTCYYLDKEKHSIVIWDGTF